MHEPFHPQVETEHILEHGGEEDKEIQIPGESTDLEEVEQLMRGHNSVRDAALVFRDGPDSEVIGFVTLHEGAVEQQIETLQRSGDESETQQVQLWESVFDRGIYTSIDRKLQPESIGRDFTGWVSAYDGSALDKVDMNEWLDDTIATVLSCHSGGALNVLELGTGSGMLLFSLARRLHSYFGLEISRAAVEFVTTTARSIPEIANKVQVYQGSATDFHLLGSFSPNVVVINSVAQYFPSRDYLAEVVEGILRLDNVRTIFFGDIRSHALQKEFLVGKALYKLGPKASKGEVREEMAEMAQAELELLVDPAFFTGLSSRFSDFIEHVEVLPKQMNATNELSQYRYAAIIHVKNRSQAEGQQQQEIREVRDDEWVDFMEHNLDHDSLLRRLEVSSPSTLAVSNIPYSKTIFERQAIESINAEPEKDDPNWLSSARQKSQSCPSLSALDLVSLGQKANYGVAISWARQYSQHGGLDAVFHRRHQMGPVDNSNRRVMFRFPTDHQGRAPASLSTQPLQQQARQAIQQHIFDVLDASSSLAVVPDDIVIVEKLPRTKDGEVDREALARRA